MDEDTVTSTQAVVIETLEVVTKDSWALYGLIVTIILAATGWGISVWLQQRSINMQMRAQIGYDIYSQLVQAHKELQDTIAALNASTSAPLILMSAKMVPYEVQLNLGSQARMPALSEDGCVHKGSVKYTEWLYDELFAKYSLYQEKLSAFMYLTEDWTAPLASAEKAVEVLRQELSRLNAIMSVRKEELQNYSRNHGDDWRKWDNEDVYAHGRAISDPAVLASCYIGDLMVLAHNELLAPYYGYERGVRKTLDDGFQVLTKDGLVTRIEDDPKIRAWAEEINKQSNFPQ